MDTNEPVHSRIEAPTDIFVEVFNERVRQDAQWGEQNHPEVPRLGAWGLQIPTERAAKAICETAFQEGKGTWAHIAVEELAEVIDAPDVDARRQELVQLAAVCVAWIEAIDRRERRANGEEA